jgi:hypothetical protein
MPRFRANFTDNHLAALLAVWRLINATAQAVAYSQNMPDRRDYWKRYLNDLADERWLVSKLIHSTSRTGKVGRKLGTFYALSKDGANVIAETLGLELERVYFPRSGIHASSPFQFPHRAEFIEVLGLFLGHQKASEGRFEVLDLVPYYRHEGANRLGTGKAATSVRVSGDFKTAVIVPDAVMRFRVDDVVRLAAIEYHRETDTRAIIEQLRKHGAAIEQGLFSAMFEHEAANHVLSIHANADKLRNVRERIEAGEFPGFNRYEAGFHFSTVEDLSQRGIQSAFFRIPNKSHSLIFNN